MEKGTSSEKKDMVITFSGSVREIEQRAAPRRNLSTSRASLSSKVLSREPVFNSQKFMTKENPEVEPLERSGNEGRVGPPPGVDKSGSQGSSSSRTEVKNTEKGRSRFRTPKFVWNPDEELIQKWNKFFIVPCVMPFFIDLLFTFLISVNEDMMCIYYDKSSAKRMAVVKSFTDFFYLIHIIIQFNRENLGANYLRGYVVVDLLLVLPFLQVLILAYPGVSSISFVRSWLDRIAYAQYSLRVMRVVPLMAKIFSDGSKLASAFAFSNIFLFILVGQLVGSLWYSSCLTRVITCLTSVCWVYGFPCGKFLECGHDHNKVFALSAEWASWRRNATSCLTMGGLFDTGIFQQAPMITKQHSLSFRYFYSLFWGFQQLSTLAGNQIPNDDSTEVFLGLFIIFYGLMFVAILIGNVQSLIQGLQKREFDDIRRRHDVEYWMSNRDIPPKLKKKIKKFEQFNRSRVDAAFEKQVIANLPEDLQKEIRGHLFAFLDKVCIFSELDEPILDAFHQALTQKLYLETSIVQARGFPVDKMVFIAHGQMTSSGTHTIYLLKGDVFGEELLAWHLEAITGKNKEKSQSSRLRPPSDREVRCLTDVIAFVISSSDLEKIVANFETYLQEADVQRAIRSQLGKLPGGQVHSNDLAV